MSQSTALAIINPDELVPLEDVQRDLDALIEAADTEILAEGRRQYEAAAMYARRQGAKERADYYGRVKVYAEAAIGVIDLHANPQHLTGRNKKQHSRLQPLVISGEEINKSHRQAWRLLGLGRIQNILEAACDQAATREHYAYRFNGCGTKAVVQILRDKGVGYVDREQVLKRMLEYAAEHGETVSDIVARAGSGWAVRSSKQTRISWSTACAIYGVIGADPTELTPMPGTRRKPHKRRLLPSLKLRGGRWDTAYSRHRKTMEEIFHLTGESDHPELWEHLHAIDDFLKRRI